MSKSVRVDGVTIRGVSIFSVTGGGGVRTLEDTACFHLLCRSRFFFAKGIPCFAVRVFITMVRYHYH